MSKKVYIFLADGFEDIEGLTVVDLMRRAGITITTVSIKNTKQITTAHGITMLTDTTFCEADFSDADMLVLPGGQPGTAQKCFQVIHWTGCMSDSISTGQEILQGILCQWEILSL